MCAASETNGLASTAIVLYRGLRYARKKHLKVSHAAMFACVMVLAIIGLVAVFDSHNYAKPTPIPNLYSLHSWIGLAAVILFGLQVSEDTAEQTNAYITP